MADQTEHATSNDLPEWQVDVALPEATPPRPGTVETHKAVPRDLRRRLERARLETLVLLRSMDWAHSYTSPRDFSPELRALMELDADCGEALWGLDQPLGEFSVELMLRDTLDSLERLPRARSAALAELPEEKLRGIETIKALVAGRVQPEECYNHVKR